MCLCENKVKYFTVEHSKSEGAEVLVRKALEVFEGN